MNSQGKSIALFGATGLVGRECLRLLLDDRTFSRVLVFTRRPLSSKPDNSARLARLETHVIDFEQLERHAALLAVDQILCALGTTMRKAGSRQQFRRVDLDYPLAIARIGLGRGPVTSCW